LIPWVEEPVMVTPEVVDLWRGRAGSRKDAPPDDDHARCGPGSALLDS
jgi:hypothetical protein